MLKVDPVERKMVPAEDGTLGTEDLQERADLQALIVNSWDAFTTEVGLPGLMLLGQEIQPHPSCANRIDILAFDGEKGCPVVVELKRDRHRLHLLQALSYAGMLSTWTADDYLALLGDSPDNDDLRDWIKNPERNPAEVAVMLVAEQFDPEVMLTAEWLATEHDVPVSCFSLKLFRFANDLHMMIQRDYPLRGIDDLYVARRQVTTRPQEHSRTWSDVKAWVSYDWAADAIDLLLTTSSQNDAGRRYFATAFPGLWGGHMLYVHKNEMKVRFHSRREGDLEHWRANVPGADVGEWGSADTAQGISISLPTRAALDGFREGLQSLPATVSDSAPD